ncbi:MAG: DNA starvation/stationary phase protection protein [Planctomycetes bacterium]|nr:DNA starvation/stationary phase protection protein [Planctomycetota bacterium]
MAPKLGLDEKDRKAVAKGLSRLLAETYVLYLKTHAFHWNVTGPHFQQLHLMFMDQYTEMWNAVDVLAERIRALGEFAPGSYSQFVELSSIKETGKVPGWKGMVEALIDGHETLIRTCRELLPKAQGAGDESSATVVTDRLGVHEKTAWMLRSLLE